jgi:hypothetical protein
MTDLFQKMIASNKWFYPVSLTLLAVHTTLSLTKKHSFSVARASPFKSP